MGGSPLHVAEKKKGEYYNNIVKDSLSVTTEMPNFKSALHSDASNCFTSLICSLKCNW